MHAPLWVNGRLRKANFAGPGTNILDRLRRGDQPISGVDKVAKAHDLRYTLANGDVEKEREADNKMLSKLKDPKLDNRFNRAVGYVPIRAKVALENKGLFPRGHMSRGPELSSEDRELVQINLDMLAQEGFGLPGEKLRQIAVLKGCGKLPTPPPELPLQVPPDQIQKIREIAMALGVPHRIDEWIQKQNLFLWWVKQGIPEADAGQAAYGNEKPWAGIINNGVEGAKQVDPALVTVATQPQPTPPGPPVNTAPSSARAQPVTQPQPMEDIPVVAKKRKRPTIGKEEFLARMALGKAKKMKKNIKAVSKSSKMRKMHKTTKAKWNKKLKALLRKYGKGLQLAGALKLAGTGAEDLEKFELPDTFTAEGLATQLGGALKKYFNIEAPADLMAKLGDCMVGGKVDWSDMEEKLLGHIPLSS